MGYINEIEALLADNNQGLISAEDLRRSFSILDDNTSALQKTLNGWRINNNNQELYLDIGQNAIDFTIGTVDNVGASGDNAFSQGLNTIAKNQNQHSIGMYNIANDVNTIHEIGIGSGDNDRKNAFEVYIDGKLRAPELTTALIDHPRSLVTKEYADANGGGSSTFADLTDVELTNINIGDSVTWDGNKWINQEPNTRAVLQNITSSLNIAADSEETSRIMNEDDDIVIMTIICQTSADSNYNIEILDSAGDVYKSVYLTDNLTDRCGFSFHFSDYLDIKITNLDENNAMTADVSISYFKI